jgi:hypothetical protein
MRCLRCGQSLMGQPVGGSPTYREAARNMDVSLYGRIGAWLGVALTVILRNTVFSEVYLSHVQVVLSALFVALVLRAAGRYMARRKL